MYLAHDCVALSLWPEGLTNVAVVDAAAAADSAAADAADAAAAVGAAVTAAAAVFAAASCLHQLHALLLAMLQWRCHIFLKLCLPTAHIMATVTIV